jgi:SAM-dependent methyltransferase
MSDKFYKALEEKFRGSRELIKSRLLVYRPFIQPLLSFYEDAKAIDLGCGRGEWLELLKESGFDGHGVDLDECMLAACRERSLSVATEDAISALKKLPNESQAIVTGFHIAEHIRFADLQLLVQEALRVLKPGGLLILETPNPENITVGTNSFYLDPTHQRPIPPALLSFLPEYYGYAKIKVIRLQEDKSLFGQALTSLHDVLSGVSPDYAVIAQKSADMSLLSATNDSFAQEYGLTLDMLTAKFDQQASQANDHAVQAETYVAQANDRVLQAESHAKQANDRAAQAESHAKQANDRAAQAESHAKQASDRIVQAEMVLSAVYASRSWTVTAPARWMAMQMRLLQKHGLIYRVKALIKKIAKTAVRRIMVFLDTRPALRSRCIGLARKTKIYDGLRTLFFGVSQPGSALVSPHTRGPASLRMMSDVNLAIKNSDNKISVIYLEME